ncbi:DUF3426 domain-containing protein [Paraburkholderia sartisoli]|uniref:MJ0042 family finger-like domain-containing protein n=1 Tax=Paraburkholderia sartisoli TaxID=83784 RepID=A0A1H4HSE5_9BURK|nr:DUF3426 domain-containing protein [Paraburkholderia sartisoli]SEB24611.1 MJ0042 family finger-like domain-containing protein [Paraburkholderia sartisoli]
MLLATRCPFCETVFRLQPTHLSLRRGLVRCGHCHEVFDASSSLYETTDGDLTRATPVGPDVVAALIAGSDPKQETVSAPAPEPVQEPESQRDAANALPRTGTPAETATNASPAASVEPHTADAPHVPFEAPEPVEPHAPTFEDDAHRHPGDAPNFRTDAWNPWAPAPDALIDDRLRHSTKNLPYRPLSESAMAKLKIAIEREAAEHAAHNGSAAAPEHDFPAVHEPLHEPLNGRQTADDRDATRARPGESLIEEPAEPAFATAPVAGAIYPETRDSEPHFTSPAATPFATPLDHGEGAEPFAVVRETREAAPRRIGWTLFGLLVALVLFVALAAQLAWWQRETVMVYWPASQPLYARACAQLGCTVAPPRDIDGLQVEPSDLRQVDGPHKLELKMPLRNRFGIALAYPAIELTLLDAQNNIVIRRVLWPQDYVTPGTSIAAGLPAHATQTMIVRLDTGNAVASNFRVQIFYP